MKHMPHVTCYLFRALFFFSNYHSWLISFSTVTNSLSFILCSHLHCCSFFHSFSILTVVLVSPAIIIFTAPSSSSFFIPHSHCSIIIWFLHSALSPQRHSLLSSFFILAVVTLSTFFILHSHYSDIIYFLHSLFSLHHRSLFSSFSIRHSQLQPPAFSFFIRYSQL